MVKNGGSDRAPDRLLHLEHLLAEFSVDEILHALGKRERVKTRPLATKVVYAVEVPRSCLVARAQRPPRRAKARLPGVPEGNPYGLKVA